MRLSVTDVCAALEVEPVTDGFITGVSTDTRTIKPGDLFIALKGESFDGNRFAAAALDAGAAMCVCSDNSLQTQRTVFVNNTLDALMSVASLYRSSFDMPIAAVTGSSGKTTARSMLAKVFTKKYDTLVTQGNLNNEIGVPTMLLRLEPHHTAAVLEMGMNHFGELERISRCAKPTFSLITNVGTAHIENLGSREGILSAKLEVTAGMSSGSKLIVNGDNDMLAPLQSDKFEIVRFGIDNAECEYTATAISLGADGSRFTLKTGGRRVDCYIPAAGMHNVYNALSAVAAGECAGIDPEEAADALKGFVSEGQRQKIVRRAGVTFIEDCYNANPDSVKASLNTLSLVSKGRRIAVLADMLELGEYAQFEHDRIGKLVAESGVDVLLTFGTLSQLTAEAAKKNGCEHVQSFEDKATLAQYLMSILKPEDTVLFKGSRSMRLEDVIDMVYAHIGEEDVK